MWIGMNICLSQIPEEEAALITNPNKPVDQKAGRMLGLKEAFRITDEAGDFVFRSPRMVQVTEDGSIYMDDKGGRLGQGIVHKFRDGKFVRDLVRIGQGPGEFPMGATGFFAAKESVVLNKYPDTLVWFDPNGDQTRDVSTAVRIHEILAFNPPLLLGASPSASGFDRKSGIRTTYYPLRTIDEKGTVSPIPVTLTTKAFYGYPSGGGVYMVPLTEILSAYRPPDEVYISHTREYLIHVFSWAKRRIVLRFNRDYAPVKQNSKRGNIRGWPDVENDVQKLFVHQDEIWVLTSTEKDKHPLIDVFDRQGKYIDAFYLPLDARDLKDEYGLWYAMAVFDDSLYVIQTIQKGDMALVKYLIEE